MKLETLRKLRGGVIYHAVDVNPQTVRSWPVNVGTRQGERHPRYSVEDAVLLALMKALTVDFGIGAARAGAIVSDIRAVLPRLLTDWENELSRKKRWRWHGGPFLVAPASDGGMTDAPVIVDQHAILRCLTDETARPKNVVISLQAMMSRVVYRVQMLVSGEELIPYLDDDTGLKVAAFNALPETYQAIMGGEA